MEVNPVSAGTPTHDEAGALHDEGDCGQQHRKKSVRRRQVLQRRKSCSSLDQERENKVETAWLTARKELNNISLAGHGQQRGDDPSGLATIATQKRKVSISGSKSAQHHQLPSSAYAAARAHNSTVMRSNSKETEGFRTPRASEQITFCERHKKGTTDGSYVQRARRAMQTSVGGIRQLMTPTSTTADKNTVSLAYNPPKRSYNAPKGSNYRRPEKKSRKTGKHQSSKES
jgi:hypothetical protein